MKFLFGLLVLFTIIEVRAEEIRIDKMSRDGALERSYVLRTNLKDKVVIDCQSFIQGLRIGEFEEAFTYMLDPEECDGLQERIRTSLKKRQNHCIDVDSDIRSDHTCS